MNWGGKQIKVRDTKIKDATGYLGPYSPKLQIGDVQKMVFTDDDDGPFHMSPISTSLI
jgi:hypothetical protein